ncbi:biotin--[acetyl-CoA-carboxylase] ligase [Halostreptopolyspora alba]|uniref:biotin--[biotin carboxyl-carrier protein] ligase n=1 Tax=Halostreptopolyspora alba TaxID=2487137 RepID=A0A3N0E3E8_9ACTN|nr:biotin--[acetyl-CoA-carboxylase] ligase [Nocardiopsaceae bacterium YIM 96095]
MGNSPYADVDRPPLRAASLNRALARPGEFWREIDVCPESASTNTDLVNRAREGAAQGTVLVAEHQTAGRGRLGRTFTTPPRAALTFSVLVRPDVPAGRYGWLPLLMGVAAMRGISRVAELSARLKWPNDVLAPAGEGEATGRKLAGILAEAVPGSEGNAVVVGMGLNVSQEREELPVDSGTSLALEGAACTDRDPLLRAVLRAFATCYQEWESRGGDAEASGLAPEYRERCDTIGRPVRVFLPDDRVLEGRATSVDSGGQLVVRDPHGGEHPVGAGDVVHVRPTD